MKKLAWFVIGCALTAAVPRAARACGGFFCGQVPVDQSGEQILFSINGSHVTAHIQISYQGEAKDFAWVVPVAQKPVISLGSKTVFSSLAQTAPRFDIKWPENASGCYLGRGGINAGGLPTPTAAPGAPMSPVTVLDMSEVGPFETVTLEATDSSALVNWLNAHQFTQPAAALPLIDHYVQNHWLFVALRLTKDASVGEIQPVVLDMDTGEACVPLILTSIAALPDMPVTVYLLGHQRAVPRNWFEVEVNPRQIDWLSYGNNYNKVATAAINDAAGHAFVTEYAGSTTFMKDVLYSAGRYDLTKLAAATDPMQFLNLIIQMNLPRDQNMLALLRKYLPLPASLRAQGVTEQQFYNALTSSPGAYAAQLAGLTFDSAGFAAALGERVVKPLQDAQKLFDQQPYLTRLYSTVSADEMTRDPLFQFNGDLKTVSNEHHAVASGTCGADHQFHDVTLTFENGDTLKLPGVVTSYPPTPWTYGAGEPSARQISLAGQSGASAVYSRAQAVVADGYLDKETPEAVRARTIPGPPDPTPGAKSSISYGDGGGCSLGAGGSAVAPVAVLGLVLLFLRRQRRRG
jgi:MYXO-CTERM domain-containing protein